MDWKGRWIFPSKWKQRGQATEEEEEIEEEESTAVVVVEQKKSNNNAQHNSHIHNYSVLGKAIEMEGKLAHIWDEQSQQNSDEKSVFVFCAGAENDGMHSETWIVSHFSDEIVHEIVLECCRLNDWFENIINIHLKQVKEPEADRERENGWQKRMFKKCARLWLELEIVKIRWSK